MQNASDTFFKNMETSMGGVPCDFSQFQPQGVMVGQDITGLVSMFGKKIRTGSGLIQDVDTVVATQAGILRFEPPNIYWIEHPNHRVS